MDGCGDEEFWSQESTMTKGKALLEARRVLGPKGHVYFGGDSVYYVGTLDENGFRISADGTSWEEALGKIGVIIEAESL